MRSRAADFRIGQGWRDLPRSFADSECGTIGLSVIKALRERILKLADDSARVGVDGNLSEIGRERRLCALAAEARSSEQVASAVATWRSARQERESFLERQARQTARVDPPEEPVEISLDSEIRAHLRHLRRAQRVELLEQAVRRRDIRPVRAVLTAPNFLSGISKRERENLILRVGWLQTAAEPSELEVLRRASEIILVARRSFERIIQELTGDPGQRRSQPIRDERRYTPYRREDQQVIGSQPIRSREAFHPRARVFARTR